jgi:O-antigen/teichoic acid export membrane protein
MRRALTATAVAQIAALGCGAATNILYARLLEPDELGRLAVSLALALAVALVADAGLGIFATRALARLDLDVRLVASVALSWTPASAVAATALLAVGASLLSGPLGFRAPGIASVALVLELAVAFSLHQWALAICQGVGAYGRRSTGIVLNALVTVAVTAAALAFFPGVSSAVHASALGFVAGALVAAGPLVWSAGLSVVAPGEYARLVRAAVPLWANGAVTFATSSADVLLAALLFPLEVVGQYHVAKKLAVTALAAVTALLPVLYADLARHGRAVVAATHRLGHGLAFGIGSAVVAAGGVLGAPGVRLAFGEEYVPACAALLLLVAAGTLGFAHNLLGYTLTAEGHFARPIAVNLTTGLMVAGVAWPLTASLGLAGLAASLVTANAAGLAVAVALTRRIAPGAALELIPGMCVLAAATAVGLWALQGAQEAYALGIGLTAAGALLAWRRPSPGGVREVGA